MISTEQLVFGYIKEHVRKEYNADILGNVMHGRLIFPATEERRRVMALKCTYNPNLLERCFVIEIPTSIILSYIKSIGHEGYAYYDDNLLIVTIQK